MKVLAVITARGGSKGAPGKNIAIVGGRPMIAWTIEAARQSKRLSRVILSTEDDEIARVSKTWGVEVPFLRPPELARDDSPHAAVVIHAIETLEARGEAGLTHVLLLQPTSPLRTGDDIDGAIELADRRDADSVVGVSLMAAHPYWSKRLTEEGRLVELFDHPDGDVPRQKLPGAYAPNGSLYLVRRDVLLSRKTMRGDRSYGYVLPPERSLDVDTPWDVHLADLILRDRNAHPTS
jgi:CMP-N,N'-diacetyllegionaminic acid synthase